jgi:excisionase family DNA binding protein
MFHDIGDILTINDLMEMLQIGRNAAYNLLSTGQIKSFRVGRSHRITREQVISYIIQNCRI